MFLVTILLYCITSTFATKLIGFGTPNNYKAYSISFTNNFTSSEMCINACKQESSCASIYYIFANSTPNNQS